jgi:formylmethanofuran dehydrogenase subunit E
MPDPADYGNEEAQAFLNAALAQRYTEPKPKVECGECTHLFAPEDLRCVAGRPVCEECAECL